MPNEVEHSIAVPSKAEQAMQLIRDEGIRLLRSLVRHGIVAGFYAGAYLAWVHWFT